MIVDHKTPDSTDLMIVDEKDFDSIGLFSHDNVSFLDSISLLQQKFWRVPVRGTGIKKPEGSCAFPRKGTFVSLHY